MRERENAKDKLADALVSLMQEKKFEEISVTDISDRAGVSRMAFYRNVQSKEELLKYRLETLSLSFVQDNVSLIPFSLLQYFENMFSFFWEQREFLSLLERSGFLYLMKNLIDRYYFEQVRLFNEDKELHEYESYYFSGALYNLFLLWEKKGMKESPREMAEVYCTISQRGWERNTEEKTNVEDH